MQIKISEDGIIYNKLPFSFRTNMPYFEWVLPTGISQTKYCVELKTRYPRLLTGGTIGYGYYNSGLIQSSDTKHKVLYHLDSNTWMGSIEIRIRILNASDQVVYSTHDQNGSIIYDFEPTPQYYLWDITTDFYYCVRDISYSTFNKQSSLNIEWNNSKDDDDDLFERIMKYQIQVSGSPLFDDGSFLFNDYEQYEIGSVTSSINYSVSDFNKIRFYRVRAYDGYDYGDWSIVRAFIPFYNSIPVCEIIDVNTNIYPRSEGEISIDFIIHDDDNTYANAFLEYSLGYVIPESNTELLERCTLLGTNAIVPTNKQIKVTWLSARTIVDMLLSGVYIYLHAYDGLDNSTYDSFGPININNMGIGFGVGGGSIDNLDYRISGKSIDIVRYWQIPEERIVTVDGEQEIDFEGTLENNESFIGASYLANTTNGNIKKNIYAMYHGYDFLNDERLINDLVLDYRNESKYRILRELGYTDRQIQFNQYPYNLNQLFSGFSQIYLQQHRGTWLNPAEEDEGVEMGLGRENDEVFYNLKRRPDIEPYIKLHRPYIGGGYGLYIDGPGINGNVDDYGEYENNPKGELWSNMYAVGRLHNTTGSITKFYSKANDIGNQIIYSANYPFGMRLWKVFYVKMEIRFPLTIVSIGENQNDKFCYIINEDTEISGSISGETNFQQFDFPYTSQYSFDQVKMNNLLDMLNRMFSETGVFDQVTKDNFTVDFSKRKMIGYAYGRKSHRLKSLEVVKTSSSCYDALGIETIFLPQTYEDANGTSGWDGSKSEFATYEDIVQELEYEQEDSEYKYQLPYESSFQYTIAGDSPTPLEPLFTCSTDDVDENGFHFRYSNERYKETGQVYVRTYKTESCLPYEDAVLEYRNFIVVPTEKPGIYRRKKIKEKGGLPAETKFVTLETGETEIAYFEPGGETCLSHTLDEGSGFYTRIPARGWLPKICHKTLFVAEYLPCELAMVQNYIDKRIEGNLGYFRRLTSVNPYGNINSGYNLYLMGAYKPSKEQLEQGLEVLPSYDYISIVSSDQDGDISRFNKHWLEYAQDATAGGCDLIYIDPNLMGFISKVIVQHAYGYQSDVSQETYFKTMNEESSYDRHAIINSYYVHGILRDQHLSPRFIGKIIKDYGIISDASFMLINNDFVKRPLMDMRLRGRYDLESRNYFSGIPGDEHPAYADRPDIVYREDRPWRINGFVQRLEELKTWGFRFLQSEWNTYNKIHWFGSQSKYNYAKIEASQKDIDGNYIDWFGVKTESAVWFDNYGWLIPYNKVVIESNKYDVDMFNQSIFPKDWINQQIIPADWFGKSVYQSDYIDTLNQENFYFGNTYRFRISSINIVDGSTIQPATSTPFILDMDAASPPVIVSMSIDKWTKILTIKFRFDDIQNRKYDLSDFHYSIDNGTTWVNNGFQYLEGNLYDLDSNISGGRVAVEQNLIIHEIRLNLGLMMEVFEKPAGADDMYEAALLVRLTAVLSEDKTGLTYPVFEFKMWLNELLKSSEDQIYKIAGGKTRWKYVEETDQDGNVTGLWEYLPLGSEIIIPGEIKVLDNQIAKIEDGFSKWYVGVKKYYYPSVDARLDYITYKNNNEAYKLFNFNKYLIFNLLETEYVEYVSDTIGNNTTKMNKYLQDKSLIYDFDDYCYRRNINLSNLFLDYTYAWIDFQTWYNGRKVEAIESVYDSFITYYSLQTDYATYKTENEIAGEDYPGFLNENNLIEKFEIFYDAIYQYTNEKSVERIKYIEDYSVLYDTWLLNPVDLDGNSITFNYLPVEFDSSAYDDDKAVWFLEWAYKNNEVAQDDFINNFVDTKYVLARQTYLMQDRGGISLSQQYSSMSSERLDLLKKLNAAYAERNYYETRHRARLIREGCFSNGFVGNMPYSSGTTVNTAFRFRVENKPIEGNPNALNEGITPPSYIEGEDESDASLGYENRFDVYFHFQLDFFNTFDSQDGLPLRDIIYQDANAYNDNNSEEVNMVRIPAGIVAEAGMKSSPNHVYNIRDEYNGYDIVTTVNPNDKRYVGNYSILKSELPGKLPTDTVPSLYDSYNELYFWRVAPYNLIERPIVEISFGESDANNVEFVGYDESSIPFENIYKFNYLNRFPEKILETYVGGNSGGVYGQMQNLIQVATSEKVTPTWQLDEGSGTYNYYTWDTHINKGDMWYKSELTNKNMLGRGEVQFLTDRAREIVDDENGAITDGTDTYSIKNIEDRSNNFHALWIPFNTNRGKPCVIRNGEKCEYYMFYHKLNSMKTIGGNPVESNVIVFSIGFNPFIFGEVQRCFPLTANIDISYIIENAVSFENPWVIKENGVYHMFFNAIIWNSAFETKVYTCHSSDLSTWTTPILMENLNDCTDVMIYKEDDTYKLYCIKSKDFNIGGNIIPYKCIFSAVSMDLDSFETPEFVYGGDYQLNSPCFCNERLYYSVNSLGHIVSIGRTQNNAGVGIDEFNTDYPEPDANNPRFEITPDVKLKYCNPCIIEDYDLGNKIERMYFNFNQNPYLWDNGELKKFGDKDGTWFYYEKTIGTMYLEKYNWTCAAVNDIKINGSSIPISGWEYSMQIPCSVEGVELEIHFRSGSYVGDFLAFRVPMNMWNETVESESRAEWISKNNLNLTEATMIPEVIPEDYNINDYKPLDYLLAKDLFDEYNTWKTGYEGETFATEDEYIEAYLVYSRQYGDYLKWSIQGPGVYRQTLALEKLNWFGDGE